MNLEVKATARKSTTAFLSVHLHLSLQQFLNDYIDKVYVILRY